MVSEEEELERERQKNQLRQQKIAEMVIQANTSKCMDVVQAFKVAKYNGMAIRRTPDRYGLGTMTWEDIKKREKFGYKWPDYKDAVVAMEMAELGRFVRTPRGHWVNLTAILEAGGKWEIVIVAEAEPEPRGTVIAPVTPEEKFIVGEHLDSDSEARQWGREGWARADDARAWCEKRR